MRVLRVFVRVGRLPGKLPGAAWHAVWASRVASEVRCRGLALVLGVLTVAVGSAQASPSAQPSDGQSPGTGAAIEGRVDSALDLLEAALESPSQSGSTLETHRLRGLRPEVVGALFSSDPRSDFPIEVLAPAVAGSGDRAPSGVGLFIEIDGADFLGHNQAETTRVEVYVYALADDDRVVGHLAEMFTVDIASLGESIWQSGLKFHGGLVLDPGRYELRVMVQNYQSGARSVRRVRVEIPRDAPPSEPGAAQASEARPVPVVAFAPPGSRDAWLPVESASFHEVWPRERILAGGAAMSPAARAVLVSGREAEIFVLGGAADSFDPGPTEPFPTGARIEFAESESQVEPRPEEAVAGQARAIVSPVASAEGRVEAAAAGPGLRVLFEVPEIPPGRYRLRLMPLAARAGLPEASATAWVPVAVVGEATRERELLWSDLRWMFQDRPDHLPGDESGVRAGSAGAPAPAPSRGGRAVRRLAERYRSALGELGSAAPRRANSAVFDLESEVLGQGDRKAQLNLRTAEASVAKEVAARNPQALAPLLLLHSDLVEQYRARRIFSLVTHSRVMVEIIAELLVESGGSASLTASVLAIQGRYLQQANLVAGSRRLLTRALEHDPQSAAALLGLAASFEKYADYNRAIELLLPLVAQRPDLDEAALRLAINQARVGWLPRARLGLEALIARDRLDWVSALAAEELARTYLISADLDKAVSILEPAIRKMPRWPGLRLLLAHIYDRQGRVGGALELVAGVEVDAEAGSSARRRYDEWPRSLVTGALDELERAAREATPVLLSSLADGNGDR